MNFLNKFKFLFVFLFSLVLVTNIASAYVLTADLSWHNETSNTYFQNQYNIPLGTNSVEFAWGSVIANAGENPPTVSTDIIVLEQVDKLLDPSLIGYTTNPIYSLTHTTSQYGLLTLQTTNLPIGTYEVLINSHVGNVESSEYSLTLNIYDDAPQVNHAPVWQNIPDEIVNLSQSTYTLEDFNLLASDEDGDVLSFTGTTTGTSANCVITQDNNNNYDLTCSLNVEGITTVTLTANDGELSASESFTLTVVDDIISVNHAPVWQEIPDVEVPLSQEDYYLRISPLASDEDGDVLTFSVQSNGIANCQLISYVDQDIRVLKCSFDTIGATFITLTANDGELSASESFTLTVYNDTPSMSMNCNQDVVLEEMLQCTVEITNENVGGFDGESVAFTTVNDEGNVILLGQCTTENNGYCNIQTTINEGFSTGNDYQVKSETKVNGFNLVAFDTFHIWNKGYEIINLGLYEDVEFSIPSQDFFRGEDMYTKFQIADLNNQIVFDESLIKSVYLVVNNQEELYFEEFELVKTVKDSTWYEEVYAKLTGKEDNYYYYILPKIPLTDDVLGEGNVFYFVFNFETQEAGQNQVSVEIHNNPIVMEWLPDVYLETNLEGISNHITIDLKNYTYDLETPLEEIIHTTETDGQILIGLQNGIMEIGAIPGATGEHIVKVIADDTDGSTIERTFTVYINQEELFANAVITYEQDPYLVGQEVQFSGYESTGADGNFESLISCAWLVEDFFSFNMDTDGSPNCQFNYTFEETGSYEVILTVTDKWGYTDSDSIIVIVEELIVEDENPTAIILAQNTSKVGEKVFFDGSHSYAYEGYEIVEYDWEIIDANGIVILDSWTGNYVLPYTFKNSNSYTVKLTVTDNAGQTDSTQKIIVVSEDETYFEENSLFGSEPEKGLKVVDFNINGKVIPKLVAGEDFTVQAVVENFAGENLNDVMMRIYIPEIGMIFKSASKDLRDNERKTLTINGFLPYDIEPGIYYPQIEISDDHIRRVKVGYIEVVEG
ncbi:MAG: PKD domain-containing protein [Candidatus Woesearchaeota archaeon]